MSAPRETKIQLEELDPEAEADALLEEDERSRGDDGFKRDLADLEASESMPPPAQAVTAVKKIHPAPIICIWIFLSSSVIIMNAWILHDGPKDLDFGFPIFLTTTHLVYATIATRLMLRFTHLVDGVHNIDMSWDRWLKNIVPIGALFSASLIFSNLAYLTLNVSFIQMLKAFTSVAVLTMSVVMGLDQFNKRTAVTVVAISFGVMLASYGEMEFAMSGFIFQSMGILFEATRLVAIQKLLQGMRMDPLVSLYYYAPVCAIFNAVLIPVFEGWEPFELVLPKVGIFTLFINVNVALCVCLLFRPHVFSAANGALMKKLNIAVVFLIGCASSLVLTLSGVVKDILLVVGSVVLFGSTVTGIQPLLYDLLCLNDGISLLTRASHFQEQMAVYIAQAKALIGR
ncbi:DUF250 domain containing membrane protein [Pseudohyphozyma bogoriensis]|nr:DUF250 domain containing membrane protein [Pseudohyphozyma bogoriensis]